MPKKKTRAPKTGERAKKPHPAPRLAAGPEGRSGHRGWLLGMVNHVARLGAGPLDLERYLARVAEEVRSVFGYYWVGIHLGDYPNRKLVLRSFSCSAPVDAKVGDSQEFGQGLIGAAFSLGHSLLIDDVAKDARYLPRVPGTASELVVPILVGEFSLGAIDVQSRETHAFTDDDRLALDTIAYLVGAMVRAAQR